MHVENERREDPQSEPVTPPPEPAYEDRGRRDDEFAEPRSDYSEAPENAEPPTFSAEGNIPSEGGGTDQGQAQPPSSESGPPPQDRGGGRGRRGRRLPPPRDRGRGRGRDRDRGRGRDHRPPYSGPAGSGGGNFQQHPEHRRDSSADAPRHEAPVDRPPGSGSILGDVRAEVDRVREVLEGVLRDLEDVAEQLNKAEHEKDLAEAEIEQLRESLRRLHR